MPCKPELRLFETSDTLFQAAATEFVSLAATAVQSRGRFCVALAGGSTPQRLYALLADKFKESIHWQQVFFFFGDERDVPPDHADSNYRMAFEAMLSKVPAPAENVFRIRAELGAQTAALEYEQNLQRFFGTEFPRFDLVLLGVGPDGHTASLFPGSPALTETRRLVVANWVEKFKTFRITVTFPVLKAARCILFLASGADKARILREVFENQNGNLPSQNVCPENGKLLWLVDRQAAALLASLRTA